MKNSFLKNKEITKIGFKSIGNNVKISKNASFYSAKDISIGNNVRIDDFCILSGKITIRDNAHISAGTYLFAGEAGIVIDDYVAISPKSVLLAISDDFSGNYFANAVLDIKKRNVIKSKITIKRYSTIGTGTIILPGVTVNEGCAIGAMSLIKKNLAAWGIYAGIPCRKIKNRSKKCLKLL